MAVAAGRHGLVPVLGQCPGVGATGVTLGGGLGWLAGLFGACCDNLVSARVVTADGHVREVSEEGDAELFWGLRGAGANFGVTTSFTARLHELGPVIGGDIYYDLRDARAVLRGFREVMRDAPDTFQAPLNLARGERGLFVSFCHAGELNEADRLFDVFRSIARPTRQTVRQQDYAALATKAAATNPGTLPRPDFRAIEAVYRESITDEIIDFIVDQLAQASPEAVMGLSHYMHGEVCRVDPRATAFPQRRAHAVHLRVACHWSDPAESKRRFAWMDEWRQLIRPQANESIYANYQTYETAAGDRYSARMSHVWRISRAGTTPRTCSGATRTSFRRESDTDYQRFLRHPRCRVADPCTVAAFALWIVTSDDQPVARATAAPTKVLARGNRVFGTVQLHERGDREERALAASEGGAAKHGWHREIGA